HVTGVQTCALPISFLSQHSRYLELPLIGRTPAATALIFDLGVYAAVLGATVLMLIAIAHQTLRAARLRELQEEAAAAKAAKAEAANAAAALEGAASEPTGAA